MEPQPTAWRPLVTRWVIGVAAVGWMSAIACGVWYEVARRRQANFAEELATRMVRAEAPTRAVVAELSTLDVVGVEPLVRLATMQRDDVAKAAQSAVGQSLQAWELEATQSGDIRQFAERATTLSAALEQHAAEFGPETQRWANGLAERLVTHSDQFTPADSWEILANCDRVLSRPLQPRAVRPPVIIAAPAEPAAPAKPLPVANSLPATSQLEASGKQKTAASDGPKGDLSVLGPVTSSSSYNFQQQLGNTLRSALRFADEHAAATRRRENQAVRVTPMGPVVDVPSPQESRLQSRRARTQPPAAPALEANVVKLDAQPAASDAGVAAHGPRGRDAVAELTTQISSLSPDERLTSLERAAQLPPAEARRLLRNFVADAEPKIRIQALTMLATSGDPQLLELARERAVEDADPRVSAFASELLRKR